VKQWRLAICILFIISAFPLAADATRLIVTDHFTVPRDTVINDDLVIGAKEADVAGTVSGDLIFGGNGLSQTGPVEGSVWAGGKSIQLKGPVSGSARIFSSELTLENSVARNLMAFCGDVRMSAEAEIGQDAHMFCGNIMLGGKINGALYARCGEIIISGKVGKGANIKADKITLTPTAVIEGDFIYTSKKEAKISTGAQILGKTVHNLPGKKESKTSAWDVFWWIIWRISELITGFLLIALFAKQMNAFKEAATRSFLKTIGVGLLAFIVIPIIALLFVVTIVGLPLTLVLTAFYVVALFLASNFTGLPFGEGILRLFKKQGPISPYLAMTVGVILIQLLETVPYFGTLVLLVAAWVGLGSILLGGYRLTEKLPAQTA